GQRLTAIADAGLGALDSLHPAGGEGGDTGQVSEQVERGPFGGQQVTDRAGDGHQNVAAPYPLAVLDVAFGGEPATGGVSEQPFGHGKAADHPVSPGHDVGGGTAVGGDG